MTMSELYSTYCLLFLLMISEASVPGDTRERVLPHFQYITLGIGVASDGALGHVPPRLTTV